LRQYHEQFPFAVLLKEPETEFDVAQVCYYKYGGLITYRSTVYNYIARGENGQEKKDN